MESFYGGRRGQSFVLVKRYETIQQMIDCFKQGGNYEEVGYGEWVVIDTLSKNNPDNGKIYVRGMDYTNELGGAIYQGQFCGTQGETPKIKVSPLRTINNLLQEVEKNGGSYKGEAFNQPFPTVPGMYKEEDGTKRYHDDIIYSYYTIKDSNDNVIGCYVGFEIPRLVLDFEVEQVSPHTAAKIENLDTEHNFYDNWKLSVPQGIHGKDIEDIRYQEDVSQLQVKYRSYENLDEGEASAYFKLLDIKNVEKIEFDETTSKLKVTYSDFTEDGVRRTELIEEPIKFIKDIKVDENEKRILLTYSTYNSDGTNETELIGEPIKYPISIKINSVNQRYQITYNTYKKDDEGNFILNEEGNMINETEYIGNPIRFIEKVSINDDDKKVHVKYNYPLTELDDNGNTLFDEEGNAILKLDQEGKPVLEEDLGDSLKSITSTSLNEDKKIVIQYNTYTQDDEGNKIYDADVINEKIKVIDHIAMNEDTKKIEVFYNTPNPNIEKEPEQPLEHEEITDPINDIEKIVMTPNYRLLVKYSDPGKRGSVAYEGETGFTDLGFVRGGGLMIYAIDQKEETETMTQMYERLTEKYSDIPAGFVVAVKGVNGATEYFLYDKKNSVWISTGSNQIGDPDFVINSEESQPEAQKTSAIWGILEELDVSSI